MDPPALDDQQKLAFISKHWMPSRGLAMNDDPIYPTPSARAGYDTRSIFKRSLTGLNSEFSFSMNDDDYISYKQVKLATIVEGDPKAPFSIATTPRCRGGRYSFPGLLHFTFDAYLIMLSVKQGGIKYHFLSLYYDST